MSLLWICIHFFGPFHDTAVIPTHLLCQMWVNPTGFEFLWTISRFRLCGSRKYPYPPHGGSRNFLGVGGSKRDKFLKGRGVHKEFFFPEGLKCDRMNTYVFFQLIRGSQEKPKVLSVEIDVGFLVIYFLLLSRRQMTRTAPRHTSEHVRRRVKQNQSFNN